MSVPASLGQLGLNVLREARRAAERYGPMTSTHEGFGVLAEEVAELLDAIRANDPAQVRREAMQVSAVALRIAEAVELPAFAERSGFTPPCFEEDEPREEPDVPAGSRHERERIVKVIEGYRETRDPCSEARTACSIILDRIRLLP